MAAASYFLRGADALAGYSVAVGSLTILRPDLLEFLRIGSDGVVHPLGDAMTAIMVGCGAAWLAFRLIGSLEKTHD